MVDRRKRNPSEYRDMHKAADKLESELVGLTERRLRLLRNEISISKLTSLLSRGDVGAATRLLSEKRIGEVLEPVATQIRDSFLRGGRIGVKKMDQYIDEREAKK